MKIELVKFSPSAIEPTRGSDDAAGFDIYSVDNYMIWPTTSHITHTNKGFKIPRGYFGKIHLRLSFALCFTDVGREVIYAGYRGPVSVIFFNFSYRLVHIEKGDRFCQIIFQKIASSPRLVEVEKFTDMARRGEGSFGSTGLKNIW